MHAATDQAALREQLRSWAEDLRAVHVEHTVTLWRRWVAQRVERGESPAEARLLMDGSDADVLGSESFAQFRQAISEQPLYPAYEDILSDRVLIYPRPGGMN